MKWLRRRIFGWRPRPKKTADDQASSKPNTPDCPRPRLAFLVRDAAGATAFRLHTFEDAVSAADFIQFWFPPGLEHGTLAFWATHREPLRRADSDNERPAEVVVLIRDESRPGVIYPFSFSNMALAHSWLTREAANGLGLRSVLIYWALPVRVRRDHWGRVRLTPAEPPALRHPEGAPASSEQAPPTVRRMDSPSEGDTARPERPDQARVLPADRNGFADAAPAGEAAKSQPDTRRKNERAREVADILREVDRIVRRNRRWDRRERPFKGFGSPPGKF